MYAMNKQQYDACKPSNLSIIFFKKENYDNSANNYSLLVSSPNKDRGGVKKNNIRPSKFLSFVIGGRVEECQLFVI